MYFQGSTRGLDIQISREIAYQGKLGGFREDFCKNYINYKKKLIKGTENDIKQQTVKMGESIACYKGCSFCCCQHISASLQECEAIVYYLYNNEVAFTSFIKAFPKWRSEIKKHGDIHSSMDRIFSMFSDTGFSNENRDAFYELAKRYFRQNILCPFLSDGACLIYDMRPFVCAAHFSTSPADWCDPVSNKQPHILEIFNENMEDMPFYFGEIPIIKVTMPIVVYEILKGSFLYLSMFPGLETLKYEARNTPEIQSIVTKNRSLLRSYLTK